MTIIIVYPALEGGIMEFNSTFKNISVTCDRMVVGFTTTYAITTNIVSLNPAHGQSVLDTTLCDKVCQ
jgi:hypothetical protein